MGSKKIKTALVIAAVICIFVSFVAFFSARWYTKVYGDVGFESILYTITNDMSATDKEIINNYYKLGLIPAVLSSAACCFIIFFNPKKEPVLNFKKRLRIYPFNKWARAVMAVGLCLLLFGNAIANVKLDEYAVLSIKKTTLFEDEYVSPDKVKITFPNEKRNLIYIFLESMESTYLSEELDGGAAKNLIPNMYNMANENINFSNNSGVGGYSQISGSSCTMAALIANTSGIPLKALDIKVNEIGVKSFLPGVISLNDILKQNGYYQAVMFGSDASYGKRDKFYKQHGVDKIYDLYTARKDGIIREDYYAHWGYEDKYLYEYAKKELRKLSENEKPFFFTMLTADTHHIGGYICDSCENEYPLRYENVISCADRQIYEFLNWIKGQDFYENTTVIITGDHLTMDNQYIVKNVSDTENRHIYNCFVNSAVSTKNSKNRDFLAFDMFPTALASIGCEIEGDRLGLGTNLFSTKKTLSERKGNEYIDKEAMKSSEFYAEKFIKTTP